MIHPNNLSILICINKPIDLSYSWLNGDLEDFHTEFSISYEVMVAWLSLVIDRSGVSRFYQGKRFGGIVAYRIVLGSN